MPKNGVVSLLALRAELLADFQHNDGCQFHLKGLATTISSSLWWPVPFDKDIIYPRRKQ